MNSSAPTPGIRAARGWLLATSSVVLTLTAHASADGGTPDPSLAVAIAGLVGWVSTALADRVRLPGIIATLVLAQLVMHFALTTLHTPHTHAGPLVDPLTMVTAHAAATVLLAALIRYAERGLVVVVSSLRRLLPAVVDPLPVPAGAAPAVLVPAFAGTHTEVLLRRVNGRRGPPSGS